MTEELNKAYPRLKREWEGQGGFLLRLTNPQKKGIPDFFMSCHAGAILVEVKCVSDRRDNIGLMYHQAKILDEAGRWGRVLCLCLEADEWAMFYAGELQRYWKVLKWNMAAKFSEKVYVSWLIK
jgi:hypothetical protein